MARTVAISDIELDNDEAVALLTHVFSDQKPASLVDARVRYLQRVDFPSQVRTGRGRRTTHDLRAILKLTVALTLIDFGVPAARAAQTVAGRWDLVGTGLADAWSCASRDLAPSADDMPVLTVAPWLLGESDGALTINRLTRAMLPKPSRASTHAIFARLLVDCLSVVEAVAAGLGEVSRYRVDEINAAFGSFAQRPLD